MKFHAHAQTPNGEKVDTIPGVWEMRMNNPPGAAINKRPTKVLLPWNDFLLVGSIR